MNYNSDFRYDLEIKCNEKYKNLRYKSEYTKNKKGEIINYSNTNT